MSDERKDPCKDCDRKETTEGTEVTLCEGYNEMVALRKQIAELEYQHEADTQTVGILADVVDVLWGPDTEVLGDPWKGDSRAETHGYGDVVARAKKLVRHWKDAHRDWMMEKELHRATQERGRLEEIKIREIQRAIEAYEKSPWHFIGRGLVHEIKLQLSRTE